MAILRNKEIKSMNKKDLEEKLKDLKFQLTKSAVTANKTTAKTAEIKRTIARLLTMKNQVKEAQKK